MSKPDGIVTMTTIRYQGKPLQTWLAWEPQCAQAVRVTFRDGDDLFEFSLDRETLLANMVGDSVPVEGAQIVTSFRNGRVKVEVRVAGATKTLWGEMADWRDFMRHTEQIVAVGREATFSEQDLADLLELGIGD